VAAKEEEAVSSQEAAQVFRPATSDEFAEVIDVVAPQYVGQVRVSTPYSGHGKGQLFTPEVGSQVLVGYEQSQAEFPLVLGNLFHPQNPQQAKYTTPQNHLKGL
jgi:uncharacterized protein involved in type VI secretion and phage assembly